MAARYIPSLVILFAVTACKLPSSLDDDSLVSSLRFSPSAFDSFRRNTEMRFSLQRSSVVSITIVQRDSSRGELLVKTLAESVTETRGSHAVTWLGDTDQRLFAPSGIYLGVLVAGGRRFETTVQIFHF